MYVYIYMCVCVCVCVCVCSIRVRVNPLVGPLELQARERVVRHLALARAGQAAVVVVVGVGADRLAVVSHLVAAVGVVLRIEQPRLVPRRVRDLVELVVRATRRVEIDVGLRLRKQPNQEQQLAQTGTAGLTSSCAVQAAEWCPTSAAQLGRLTGSGDRHRTSRTGSSASRVSEHYWPLAYLGNMSGR